MKLEVQHQIVKELLDVIDELNYDLSEDWHKEIASGEVLADYLIVQMHRADENLNP
jgi:hypothetical protein